MMKKLFSLLLVLALAVSLTGCKKSKEDLRFYVLDGDLVSAGMADGVLMNLAKSKGRVAFTGADIAGWLWEDQCVQLAEVSVLGGAEDGGSRLFQAEAKDCFILALGNRVIYTGGFAPASGSVRAVRDPYIQDGEENLFYLLRDRKDGEDPRLNSRLYDYLADQQLLVSELKTEE